MDKKLKITFAPGCFDNFEGTQEELDEFIAQIQKGFESGEFLTQSQPLDVDQLMDDDPELAAKLFSAIEDIEQADEDRKRSLN
jgi:hypothetical protein